MRTEARYAAAIEVLDAWNGGVPAEQALTRWARGARYAGSKDRAAVRDHVYDVLRCKGRCAALGGGETGRALVLGLLRLSGQSPEAVFSGDGHAPLALTDAERSGGTGAATETLDVPDWMAQAVDQNRIDDVTGVISAMSRRAPVYLRVNTRRAPPEKVIAALADDGIAAESCGALATALRVTEGARKIRQSQAFGDGMVELQDLSPQWALARLEVPANGAILDYCAGGGGKALALADRTDARVYAHDALPARMRDIAPRAARAGVRIDELATSDLEASGPYDLVLTDVPCSGSGTWRRDPEAKWRLTPERLADLHRLQAEILDHAATLVGAGGQLAYMTCSLFRSENDDQIEAFLAKNPNWRCVHSQLDTPLTASDGFFSAVLTRQ